MGFQWSDGTRWNFTEWMTGDGVQYPQPDATTETQDCVEYRRDGNDIGWADIECTELLPFVCGTSTVSLLRPRLLNRFMSLT